MTDNFPSVGILRARIHERFAEPGNSNGYKAFQLGQFETQTDGRRNWNMACGATDTLYDIECGFVSILRKIDLCETPSLFESIGFLQALIIQQDAVFNLCRALGFLDAGKARDYPALQDVRELRNRAAGHPSYSEHQKPPSAAMWSPGEISHVGFRIVLYFDVGSEEVHINFRELYVKNQNPLIEALLRLEVWMAAVEEKFLNGH